MGISFSSIPLFFLIPFSPLLFPPSLLFSSLPRFERDTEREMGGCASKPKELKEEADAPLAINEPKNKVGDTGEKEGEQVVKEEASSRLEEPKESGNQSLGLLLKEMEAKEEDQYKREQVVEKWETKMTTVTEEESTSNPKVSTPTAKEESKDSGVYASSGESVVNGLPIYSSVKVFF